MLYTQTCRIGELEPFEPEHAKRLQEETEFEEGPYWYKMAKSGRVYRVLKELKAEYKRGHLTEKHKPKVGFIQPGLVQFNTTEGAKL